MNITRDNIDALNEVIRIQLDPVDYTEKVDHTLSDYRKKVRFDGFRPGKVPVGLVKKLYGKAILVDEVKKLLSDKLNQYISENQIKILGEPIPNENSPAIIWEENQGFEFHFDIGLVPEFDLTLNQRDKVIQYKIKVTQQIIDEQAESFARRYGSNQSVEEVAEKDVMKVDLIQLSDSNDPLEDGLTVFDTPISTESVADEKVRQSLIGAKVNDEFVINLNETFPNETNRASMLKVKKEELEAVTGNFRLVIREVIRFTLAEINQDLFNKAFGENGVTTLDEFHDKIKLGLEDQFSSDTADKLHLDTKEKVLSKVEVDLPEDFLKRWMLLTSKDENLTNDKIEKGYPLFSNDLKWQLIKNKVAAENEIKAGEEEIQAHAIHLARRQYQQYGLYQVPDEHLARFADDILQDKDERQRIIERIVENMVISHLQTLVKIEEKPITREEFTKLFEQ